MAYAQSGIDLSHKSIKKEIHKTFEVEDFLLHNMRSDDTAYIPFPGNEHYYLIKNELAHIGYLYIGRVNCCRATGCSAPAYEPQSAGFEYFDYMIVYDSLPIISSVKVFNYQATHGHEICSTSWLKQFIGYSHGSNEKLEENVDAISGATISVISIVVDTERASAYLAKLIEKADSH